MTRKKNCEEEGETDKKEKSKVVVFYIRLFFALSLYLHRRGPHALKKKGKKRS